MDWSKTEFHSRDRPKTLIMVGPTRLGKTQWARSLGDCALMNGNFDLSQLDEDRQYVIMEDFDRHKCGDQWIFRKYKSLFGGQEVICLTDKYTKKRSIKWGKPLIYICNELSDNWRSDSWLVDNCTIVDIVDKLYCHSDCGCD